MNGSQKGTYGNHKGTYGQKERFRDERHDAYRARKKWTDPSCCPECGAVFTGGRWTWQRASEEAPPVVCPACRRVTDNDPAGVVALSGPFFENHRAEILALLRNTEEAEKGEHPLERLMNTREEDGVTLVTTTGVHLARRIGDALARAYQGSMRLAYGDREHYVRVRWER